VDGRATQVKTHGYNQSEGVVVITADVLCSFVELEGADARCVGGCSDCVDESLAGAGDDECVRSARRVGEGEAQDGHRRREASRRDGERPEEEQVCGVICSRL
jgi:hypothetical protein